MTYEIETVVRIETTDCCTCSVVFGMPASLLAARRRDGQWFYCPNGHQQRFTETEAQRLAKQLQQAERDRDYARSARDAVRDQLQASERSRAALKGVVTRQRNRAVAGMCPVDGCRRHFADLGRHIASQHPDLQHDDPES